MDCFKGVVKLDIDCETPSGFPGIATVCGEIRVKPHSSSWKHARPLEDEGGSTQDLDRLVTAREIQVRSPIKASAVPTK